MNWILSRDRQNQFQKLTRENSLRVDIPKEGIVNPFYILDPKSEYLFTGLEEHKDKINEFRRGLSRWWRRNDGEHFNLREVKS